MQGKDGNGNGNGNGNGYKRGYVPNDLEIIRDKLKEIYVLGDGGEHIGCFDKVVYQCEACHMFYTDMEEEGLLRQLEKISPYKIFELCKQIMALNNLSVAISMDVLEEYGYPTLSHGSECWCCGWSRRTGEALRRLQKKQGYVECFGEGRGVCTQGKENESRCRMRRRCVSPPKFPEYWKQRAIRLKNLNLFPYEIHFV